MENSVFEAEVLAINEGLLWLSSLPYRTVENETDSLLAVQAINRHQENVLEVGFALDDCRAYIQSNHGWTITFAERQANKAAHLMVKISCSHECQSIFTSPPNLLLICCRRLCCMMLLFNEIFTFKKKKLILTTA